MEQMFNLPENQRPDRKDFITYVAGLVTVFFLILLLVLASSFSAHAQQQQQQQQQQQTKSLVFESIAPFEDHYKHFACIDAAAQPAALDSLSFPPQDFKRAAYLN